MTQSAALTAGGCIIRVDHEAFNGGHGGQKLFFSERKPRSQIFQSQVSQVFQSHSVRCFHPGRAHKACSAAKSCVQSDWLGRGFPFFFWETNPKLYEVPEHTKPADQRRFKMYAPEAFPELQCESDSSTALLRLLEHNAVAFRFQAGFFCIG